MNKTYLKKNLWFSDVFRGYQKRPVAWNGFKLHASFIKFETCHLNLTYNSHWGVDKIPFKDKNLLAVVLYIHLDNPFVFFF